MPRTTQSELYGTVQRLAAKSQADRKAGPAEETKFPGARSEYTTTLEFSKHHAPVKCLHRFDARGKIIDPAYKPKVLRGVSAAVCL